MNKCFNLIFLNIFFVCSLFSQETGCLTGLLRDRLTHDPILGVKVKAGNHAALSDQDGFFELQLDPGEYPLQFSRYGMESLTIDGITIPENDTVILDTTLLPVPVAVAEVRASNEGSYVAVDWIPSGPNIVEKSNDSGPLADFFVFQQAGSQVAVKYYNYNDHIVGGRIFVGDSTFPGPFLGTDFLVRVYDDEGMGGLPGNVLDEDTILVEQYGWVGFDNLDVNSLAENYYLGMLQLNDPPFCAPIACTQYPPVSHSLMKPGEYNWCPFPLGNAMIRPWVTAPHDSLYVTNYRVMRYSNFNPETEDPTQGTMVELANTGLGTSYHDFSWGGMPFGCYAYGIKAMYNNGFYSPVRVSNVICHGPPNNASFFINQTDSSTEGFTHITLTGQNWEFSRYSSWFQTPGTCNFGSVSSGKYQVYIYKPGYEMIIQDSVEIISDTVLAFDLQEKIFPIENLRANAYTGLLDWEPEHISQFTWKCPPDSMCHLLTTPEMDLTVNTCWTLTLTYKLPTDLEPASVDYSTDNGRTWAVLQQLASNTGWDTVDIDISEFSGTLGESQIMFSIHDLYGAPYYLELRSASVWSPALRGHPENYHIMLNGQPAGMSDSSFYLPDGLVNGEFYRAGVVADYSTGLTDTVFTEFLYHELFPPENLNWTEENYSLKFTWSPPSGSWDEKNKSGYPEELKGYVLAYSTEDMDLEYEINGPSDTTISIEKINCDTASVSLYAVYDLDELGYPGEYGESKPAGPLVISFEDPVVNEFYEDWSVISFVHNCWKTNGDGFAIEAGQGHPGPALIYQNTPEHYQDFLTGLPLHIPQIEDAQLTLEFDLNLFTSGQNGYETMDVQVQQAGTSSWSQVQGFSNSLGNIDWQHFRINLSGFITSDVFRIRFMFEGIGEEGVQWKIDNIHVYNLCYGPPSISAEITGVNEVSLFWDAVANARSVTAFDHYNIFRKFDEGDFSFLAATSDTFYIDYLIQGGRYCYQVNAVYNDTGIICESSFSDSAYIISTFNVSENIDEKRISIYPNPAHDLLYIKSEELIQKVYLNNSMGVEVLAIDQPGLNVEIDLNRMAEGIYLIRIESADKIYYRKIIH